MTITVEEAAEVLGISRTSAYLRAARGEIPTVRLGRRVLVLLAPLLTTLGEASSSGGQTDRVVGDAA